ncbi:MAG: STAS domain-containing protein [Lachnospiraceae bacterium]|jgi:anti-sigma B factor antagonist|nr:STAS domain-containing protein [Lachnospiraceae bacterium]MBQ9033828.1 STAS domain-containing protein [Lachnospiraceae bacterium]
MTIDKKKEGNRLVLAVSGRLDTMTAPELENVIKDNMDGVEELILDFKDLEYISSAGLRVVLGARKAMGDKGSFSVRNLCSDVREIFDITGFSDIITIE